MFGMNPFFDLFSSQHSSEFIPTKKPTPEPAEMVNQTLATAIQSAGHPLDEDSLEFPVESNSIPFVPAEIALGSDVSPSYLPPEWEPSESPVSSVSQPPHKIYIDGGKVGELSPEQMREIRKEDQHFGCDFLCEIQNRQLSDNFQSALRDKIIQKIDEYETELRLLYMKQPFGKTPADKMDDRKERISGIRSNIERCEKFLETTKFFSREMCEVFLSVVFPAS